MDIDSIPIGVDFVDHIHQVLDGCNALVAVIGPRWIGQRRGKPARIKEEADFVRMEVEAALQRKVAVIPILVDGAAIPKRDQLPEPLQPLLRRNAAEVQSGRDFHAHMDRLIRDIDRLLPAEPDPASPHAGPSVDRAGNHPDQGHAVHQDGNAGTAGHNAGAGVSPASNGATTAPAPPTNRSPDKADEALHGDLADDGADALAHSSTSSFSGKSALPRIRWGRRYLESGDADRAIASFTEAIRLDPTPGAYYGRGLAYKLKGEFQPAIEDLTEAIRLRPGDASAYSGRGAAFEAIGDFAAARGDYESALRIDPQDNDALAGHGRLSLDPGRSAVDTRSEPSAPDRSAGRRKAFALALAMGTLLGVVMFSTFIWSRLQVKEEGATEVSADIPRAKQPPKSEAAPTEAKTSDADKPKGPINRAARDPIVVGRDNKASKATVVRDLPRPANLDFPGISDEISVVSDIMLSSENRFLAKLPVAAKDFASLELRPNQPSLSTVVPGDEPPDTGDNDDDSSGIQLGTPFEPDLGAITSGSSTRTTTPDNERFAPSKDFIIKLKTRRALNKVAAEQGFSAEDAKGAAQALNDEFKLKVLNPGTIVAMRGLRDLAGTDKLRLVQVAVYSDQTFVGSVARADKGGFLAARDPWVLEDPTGQDGESEAADLPERYRLLDAIYSTAARNKVPAGIIGEAIMLLSRSQDLGVSATSDDRLLLAFSRTARKDGLGRVLYAAVNGGGRRLGCYVFQPEPAADFACLSEGAVPFARSASGAMVTPVNGVMTSTFGPKKHPILKTVKIHRGVDWAAPVGTPVFAAFDGTVEFYGDGGDSGNIVRLRHSAGRETLYAHLSGFAPGLKVGAAVKAGEIIGNIGTSGLTTGPHLHFELYQDGQAIDPFLVNAAKAPGAGSTESAAEILVDRIVRVEGGGNARAKNPLTSAAGLGQFVDSVWIRMMNEYRPDLARALSREDLLSLRFDATISREMVRRLAQESEAYLRAEGHEVTAGRLYLCHFLGMAGTGIALSASPADQVSDVLGDAVVKANPFLAGKTIGYLTDWAERKMAIRSENPGEPVVSPDFRRYRDGIDELIALAAGPAQSPVEPD